jgi:hypothetical protein
MRRLSHTNQFFHSSCTCWWRFSHYHHRLEQGCKSPFRSETIHRFSPGNYAEDTQNKTHCFKIRRYALVDCMNAGNSTDHLQGQGFAGASHKLTLYQLACKSSRNPRSFFLRPTIKATILERRVRASKKKSWRWVMALMLGIQPANN